MSQKNCDLPLEGGIREAVRANALHGVLQKPLCFQALQPLFDRFSGAVLGVAHLSQSDLLIQGTMDALNELIEASTLPFFNSDQMLQLGYEMPGRISIPIADPDAHATYWIACLAAEQHKYRSLFSAVRGSLLRIQGESKKTSGSRLVKTTSGGLSG